MLILAADQHLMIANWNIGHSKSLFNVYCGGMIQLIEEQSCLFHYF